MTEALKTVPRPPREDWYKAYEQSIDSMRSTARWVLGLLAGLLLAATSLSGFGRLNPDEWRFWLVIFSASVVIASIGYIIFLFLKVQVGGEKNWHELTPSDLKFVQEYGLLDGYDSFAAFLDDMKGAIAEYSRIRDQIGSAAISGIEVNLSYQHDTLIAQQNAGDRAAMMDWEKKEVEALLSWHPVRVGFDRARRALVRFGIVAAIATLVLVWAANPPPATTETVVILGGAATPASR
jgi:hypothetical protein